MPERDEVLATCHRTWKRLGVRREDRDELAAELDQDLREAEDDGLSAFDYVAGDPAGFARHWAEERDLVRPRFHLAATSLLAVLGGIPGAGLGLFFAYGLSSDTFREMLGRDVIRPDGAVQFEAFTPPPALVLSLYALAGLCVAAGAVIAVRTFLGWRNDPALRETTLYLALGCLPAVACGAGAGVLFAWYRDFQAEPRAMAGVGLVAAVVFALVFAALRWAAVYVIRARRNLGFAVQQ